LTFLLVSVKVFPMNATFAVIATGGKQYLVQTDTLVKVEKLDGKEGDIVNITDVLLVGEGENAIIGKPNVPGAVVVMEIVKQGRAKKVTGVKFKAKKRIKVGFGHRQPFTELKIKEIKSE